MAQTVCIILFPEDRARLAAVIQDRSSPQKHVQRAKIILRSAERRSVLDVARQSGVSRPAVWRWQRRYAEQGVDGLLRDKTRKPGKPPLPARMVAKVLALTCSEPPANATHWTGRAVAKAAGISLRAVQRIWKAHRLQPHRLRTFKKSNDPAFVEKVDDVVGLYMDPPCHAGRCMKRHRHQEFITFLNAVERKVKAGKIIHVILDNYGTHKHPKVDAWLANHPRWVFHFTPTSASWLNAVEGFFSAITRRRIRRGVFKSVADLEDAIKRYIADHNRNAKPFVWTKTAGENLEKLSRNPAPSE